ncbi:MAG: hypothetical protein K2V38_26260 [Gemmataceae bacterium]|nr:hypothetical protein [Gemmataceae bacterium]
MKGAESLGEEPGGCPCVWVKWVVSCVAAAVANVIGAVVRRCFPRWFGPPSAGPVSSALAREPPADLRALIELWIQEYQAGRHREPPTTDLGRALDAWLRARYSRDR